MKITLNNRIEEFDRESISVSEMLDIKKFSFIMRIIKINGRLIPKEEFSNTVIHDGDDVMMLYLMSGG